MNQFLKTRFALSTLLRIIFWSSFVFCLSCRAQPDVDDIENIPVVSEADQPLAGVFKMLDGHWRGTFNIYQDSVAAAPPAPQSISRGDLNRPSLQLVQTIQVDQWYRSLTPFFQQVQIRDVYTHPTGEADTAWSKGVNKVQNGIPWCVVLKPDETVIHKGTLADPATIIWQRDISSPLKKEFFRETVEQDTYTILGWGYYGEDELSKAPRWWFLGEYRRVHAPASAWPNPGDD